MNKIKLILSEKKYLWLFIILVMFFTITLIFSWSLILYSNFYVRIDLWMPLNLTLLLLTSILSALNITVSLYCFSRTSKKAHSFLAIFPAFFTTACPTCAPLFLSFWSTTVGIWFSYLANLRIYLIILSIAILSVSLWKLINAKEGCDLNKSNSIPPKTDPKLPSQII